MELSFLYIKEYGRVKDMGLNFSSKFHYKYDVSSGKLSVSGVRDFSERFYSKYDANINSISAIVGQNGVGKSTVLSFIKRNFVGGAGGVHSPCLVGIYDENSDTHQVYHFKIDRPELSSDSLPTELKRLESRRTTAPGFEVFTSINAFEDITFVNYAGMLDLSPDEGEYGDSFNITTNYYAYTASDKHTGEDRRFNFNEVDLYRIQEVERQLRFYSKHKDLLPFETPDFIILRVNKFNQLQINKNITEKWDRAKIEVDRLAALGNLTPDQGDEKAKHESLMKSIEEAGKVLNALISKIQGTLGSSFKTDIYVQFMFSVLKGSFWNQFTIDNTTGILKELLKKLDDENISGSNKILYTFLEVAQVRKLGEDEQLRYVDFIEILPALEELIESCHGKGQYMERDELVLNEENEILLMKFFELHTNITHSNFVDYYWPLSSGQQSLFSLYSRFYDVIHRTIQFDNVDVKENILILLDEAEVSLHPEWQRSFLDDFLKVISSLFKGKNIQLILTTHSPFLLSDLVLSQVNFIDFDLDTKRGKVVGNPLSQKKSTFGSNITTLLQDSFFMKDGFAGGIVLREMDDFIDLIMHGNLADIKKDYDYIDWFIHQIGEPIVRNKMIQLLESRLSADLLNTIERLDNIEKRLDNLETEEDDTDKEE